MISSATLRELIVANQFKYNKLSGSGSEFSCEGRHSFLQLLDDISKLRSIYFVLRCYLYLLHLQVVPLQVHKQLVKNVKESIPELSLQVEIGVAV